MVQQNMIMQWGACNDAYGAWPADLHVFVCRPYFKIVLDNGAGVYVLNAFEYNLFPKFYYAFEHAHWIIGFRMAGWTLQVAWHKCFEK